MQRLSFLLLIDRVFNDFLRALRCYVRFRFQRMSFRLSLSNFSISSSIINNLESTDTCVEMLLRTHFGIIAPLVRKAWKLLSSWESAGYDYKKFCSTMLSTFIAPPTHKGQKGHSVRSHKFMILLPFAKKNPTLFYGWMNHYPAPADYWIKV